MLECVGRQEYISLGIQCVYLLPTAVQYREAYPRRSRIPDDLNLGVQTCLAVSTPLTFSRPDISYTRAPDWIKMIPNYEHDQHVTFWSLARLAFPTTRKASLVTPLPSKKHGVSLPPDEHLLCYDYGALIFSDCFRLINMPL